MPEPTNPKKRALMPSTKLRKTLRGAGHHLSPVVQVGKEGVTEAVVRQLDEALQAHELVKVKVGTESPEDRFEAADALGGATDGQVAQILGRTILVYRRHPERPRYEPAPAARAEPVEPRARKGRATRDRRGPPRKGQGGRAPARNAAGGRAPARNAAAGRPAPRKDVDGRAPARKAAGGRAPARKAPGGRAPARKAPGGRKPGVAKRPAGRAGSRPAGRGGRRS